MLSFEKNNSKLGCLRESNMWGLLCGYNAFIAFIPEAPHTQRHRREWSVLEEIVNNCKNEKVWPKLISEIARVGAWKYL
jgi:hypothetical protein